MDTRDSVDGSEQVVERSLDYVLDFQRYEFKYRIPNRWVNLLVSDLHRYMDLDPYSAGSTYYPLYSVYFDTNDWQAYYEKMDGVERRKKFRVRAYEPSPRTDSTVMLEIKEKNKDVILKRRLAVSRAQAGTMREPGPDLQGESVVKEWRFNMLRDGLQPKVLVKYRRLAFVPKTKGDYRITVDTDVQWGRPSSPTDFGVPTSPVQSLRGATVLEIKFGQRPPKFVLDLIRRYDLRNDAISKYCESVVAMHKEML